MAESSSEPLEIIEGVLERIVYENTDNGFFVGRLQVDGQRNLTTVVGNLMAVSPGERLRLSGKWIDDPKWGRQLRIEQYEMLVPSTVEGIEKYLGSGLIQGIGPAFAKRLVAKFGVDTLRIIEDQPRRLCEVPGIGPKRVAQIQEAWREQHGVHAIMVFLQSHGVSTAQAVRIYKQYGDGAAAALRENPYRLANEISGIGFKNADKIARNLGIAPDAPQRAEAGLLHVLDQGSAEGHVFAVASELIEDTVRLLEVPESALDEPLASLIARQAVAREADAVYTKILYSSEVACYRLLKMLAGTPGKEVAIDGDKAARWAEQTNGIAFSDEQREAIRIAAESKVMVVTGGPGTGKTTLVNSLVSIFAKKELRVVLAAPTGRAAKRLETATGQEARTIHRLLEFSPKQGGFVRNETNPVLADVIIVDETSMVDLQLLYNLLKAIPRHARVIFVGDVDQLPSVGPGNVLMDLIASNVYPVVWLKTVFRQASQSGIITNAHRINQGQHPEFNTTDFFFVERKDPAKALETVVELVARRIPAKFGLDPIRDIQVLAPMHRGESGVTRLNEALQQALNPNGAPVPRKVFRRGDKVMQMRNNYELDAYNGDVGIVDLVDEEAGELAIAFDDRQVLYSFLELDDLSLAYAATVHKSQGSEYPAVILLLLPQHYMLLQRNVLYTAITRGKKLVIVVGDPKAVNMAIRSTQSATRHSHLADRLRNQWPVQRTEQGGAAK